MKRTWTIIGVNDVGGQLQMATVALRSAKTSPVQDDFDQILDTDGTADEKIV